MLKRPAVKQPQMLADLLAVHPHRGPELRLVHDEQRDLARRADVNGPAVPEVSALLAAYAVPSRAAFCPARCRLRCDC